jgi:hypothetical protein
MSRWPEDPQERPPEGRRARHAEGRRGRAEPDDTLPWLAGLEEPVSPEEEAGWTRTLRPRQARPVETGRPDERGWPAEPDPWAAAPAPTPGPAPAEPDERTRAWTLDEPAGAEPTGTLRHDSDYGSWAHQLDATAVWQPEPPDWAGPADPERPPVEAAGAAAWETAAPAADPGAGDDDAAFAAAQAEARRLVEEAASRPWAAGPTWGWEDDRSGVDPFGAEPVVSFGPPPGAPGPLPTPGPGRALEPAAPGGEWPSGPGEADPAAQRWDVAAQGEQDEWLWPVDGGGAAPVVGGRDARWPQDGGVDDRPGRATTIDGPPPRRAGPRSGTGQVEGRRARRQLEARSHAAPADGRRVRRQGGGRGRNRWLLRVAVLAWIVLFAVVCWLYIFPWLEGVLPENF